MRPAAHRGLPPVSFGAGAVGLTRQALYHLLSFEMVFALFLYSNQLKLFFPQFPIDETLVLMALGIPIGVAIILREGIYLRGLPIVAAGLVLFTWAALSWGWSPSRTLAKRTLTYVFTVDLWCLIVGALILAASRERTARFLAIVLGLSMIVAGYGLYIYATFGTFRFFGGYAFGDVSRAYLSWGYAVTNGAVIAFALAIFSRVLGVRQIVAAGLFAMATLFLLVGSGRGPLLATVVACLVALVVGLPQLRHGRIDVPRWQVVGLAVVVLGAGYVIYLVITGATFTTFGRFAKLLEQAQNPDVIAGANRFDYYAKAIEFWLQAPLVGNGIASYSLLYQGFEKSGAHPHNIVLEMLSDLGLVGLALLLLALRSGLRLLDRERLRRDGLLLCVLMLLAARLLVAAMISADISGQQALFLFLGMLALRPPTAAQPRPAPAHRAVRAAPSPR
jgi:O-antigen ligase